MRINLTTSLGTGLVKQTRWIIGCSDNFKFKQSNENEGRTKLKFLLDWAKQARRSNSAIFSHNMNKHPMYSRILFVRSKIILQIIKSLLNSTVMTKTKKKLGSGARMMVLKASQIHTRWLEFVFLERNYSSSPSKIAILWWSSWRTNVTSPPERIEVNIRFKLEPKLNGHPAKH